MPTYEELIADDDVVYSIESFYNELGREVPEDRQELVDDFLTYRRAYEDNLLNTFMTKSDVDSLSDDGKTFFRFAKQEADKLPNLFSSSGGGAPALKGIYDHIKFSLTDPTNLASVVLAPFTLGTGSAAVQGGKLAAQTGIKAALMRSAAIPAKRVVNTLKDRGVQKVLAGEGAINFAGGAARENEIQNIEQEVGARETKNYGDIATVAGLEAVAAPVVGIGGAGIAEGLGRLVKEGVDAARQSNPSVDFYVNRMTNMFRPGGGLDIDLVRKQEIIRGNQTRFMRDAQNLEKATLKNNTYKELVKSQEGIDLLNRAVEGNSEAISDIAARDADLETLVRQGRGLINEVRDYAGTIEDIAPNVAKNFDRLNPEFNPNYARLIYEAFEGPRQLTFDNYLKKKPDTIQNIFDTIKRDANLPEEESLGFYKSFGLTPQQLNSASLQGDVLNKVTRGAKDMYYGRSKAYEEAGSILRGRKSEEELPQIFADLLGKNAMPIRRVMASVRGIIEPMNEFYLANETGRLLASKGKAIVVDTAGKDLKQQAEEAANLLSQQTGRAVDPGSLRPIHGAGGALPVKNGLRESSKNYFVDVKLADDLRQTFTNPNFGSFFRGKEGTFDDTLGNIAGQSAINFLSNVQGASKLFATAYSPTAMGRNTLGALYQLTATGNLRGLRGTINLRDPEFKRAMYELGIMDTGLTMNQILNRLGPDFDAYVRRTAGSRGVGPKQILSADRFTMAGLKNFLMAPVSQGGVGLTLREAYQKVDDLAKVSAYSSELRKVGNLWKTYSPEKQNQLRDQMRTFLNKQDVTDKEVISELAVRNALDVMPTYSRVPQITEQLRGIPIIGNFMGFHAEVIRNSLKSLRKGHEEMIEGFNTGNRALTMQGANRVATLLAVNGGFAYGVAALNESMMSSEELAALKRFLPSYLQFSPLLITDIEAKYDPKNPDVEDLSIKYKNMGWLNPYEPLQQLATAVLALGMSGDTDFEGAVNEYLAPSLYSVVSPFVDQSLALQGAKYLATLATEDDVESPASRRALKGLYELATPGYLKLMMDAAVKQKLVGPETRNLLDPRYYDKKREEVDLTNPAHLADYIQESGFIFAPEKEFRVKSDVGFALQELQKQKQQPYLNYRSKVRRLFTDPTALDELNSDDLLKEYEDVLQDQWATQQNYGDLLQDLKTLVQGDRQFVGRMMRDPDLKNTAFPQSQAERNRAMRDRSYTQRISDKADFWAEVRRENPQFPIDEMRRTMRVMEDYYDNKDLEVEPEPLFD